MALTYYEQAKNQDDLRNELGNALWAYCTFGHMSDATPLDTFIEVLDTVVHNRIVDRARDAFVRVSGLDYDIAGMWYWHASYIADNAVLSLRHR